MYKVAEWPPFVKKLLSRLIVCSICNMSICNFNYSHFGFEDMILVLTIHFLAIAFMIDLNFISQLYTT